MDNIDLAAIGRRPQQYWNADGIPELLMGILWMVWGAAWLIGDRIPRGSVYTAFWLVTPAFLALSGSFVVWGTRALKARITFPRAGYVAWREPSPAARFGVAAIAIVTAALLAAVAVKARKSGATSQLVTPLLSAILSLAFVVAAVRQHAPHYLGLAGVAIASGIALGTWRGGWESVNWLFLLIGVASALVGATRLALFLRTHPRAEAA